MRPLHGYFAVSRTSAPGKYLQSPDTVVTYLEQIERQDATRDYHRSLLLPASENAGKETLLRAACPQAETQPELLLRAATGEERE